MARGRMLHGSISNSAKLAALSCDGARLLFTWLIPHADNLGRMRAEPIQIKATVLPRHEAAAEQIEAWTAELAEVGLIYLYEWQGQRFLQVIDNDRYQKLTGNMSKNSDLPSPDDGVRTAYIRRTNGVHTVYERRTPEVEVEVEGKEKVRTPRHRDEPSGSPPPVVELLTNRKGETYPVTADQVAKWVPVYPGVDVIAQLRLMVVWCEVNAARRKTYDGMARFITKWLGRAQNESRGRPNGAVPAAGGDDPDDPYVNDPVLEAKIRADEIALAREKALREKGEGA